MLPALAITGGPFQFRTECTDNFDDHCQFLSKEAAQSTPPLQKGERLRAGHGTAGDKDTHFADGNRGPKGLYARISEHTVFKGALFDRLRLQTRSAAYTALLAQDPDLRPRPLEERCAQDLPSLSRDLGGGKWRRRERQPAAAQAVAAASAGAAGAAGTRG